MIIFCTNCNSGRILLLTFLHYISCKHALSSKPNIGTLSTRISWNVIYAFDILGCLIQNWLLMGPRQIEKQNYGPESSWFIVSYNPKKTPRPISFRVESCWISSFIQVRITNQDLVCQIGFTEYLLIPRVAKGRLRANVYAAEFPLSSASLWSK